MPARSVARSTSLTRHPARPPGHRPGRATAPGRRGRPGPRRRHGPCGCRRPRRRPGARSPRQRPVPHPWGTSTAVWLHAPCVSAAQRDAVQHVGRAGGVDDVGPGAGEQVGQGVDDAAAQPDRPVGGGDGDAAGGAPGLQRPEQAGLGLRPEQHVHRALALAQPLGQREQRGARAAVRDQHAGDRLLGQRERPAQRADDVERGAGRGRRQPPGARVRRLEDALDGAAVGARRTDPVDRERAAQRGRGHRAADGRRRRTCRAGTARGRRARPA